MRFRLPMIAASLVPLAACGGGGSEEALENAAEQSAPAAAAVLENAAENGMDPQQALEQAGQAQAQAPIATPPNSTLQGRPNLPSSPNRPPPGQPPQKVDVQNEAATENHAGHDMNAMR
jgi:hypothetical protein